MKPKQVIDKLNQYGYKTKIVHRRFFGDVLLKNAEIRTVMKATKIIERVTGQFSNQWSNLINNKGGSTEVQATKGDVGYNTKADCSLSDPFVYKNGVLLALKRLLEKLPEPELQELGKQI